MSIWQTERIIRNSEDLSKEQQAMKRETELLKQAEERLVMKNHKFQKTIKQLQIKLAAYEADSTKIQSIEVLLRFDAQLSFLCSRLMQLTLSIRKWRQQGNPLMYLMRNCRGCGTSIYLLPRNAIR